MELISQLTSQLGISEAQAKGGSGLLFKLAQEKLGGDDFGQLAGAVPGIESLISSAPQSGGGGMAGALGNLAGALGGGDSQLGTLASLAGGFSSLDLDAGMVSKFLPIVMSFVESQGGEGVKGLLQQVMK